MGWRTTHDLDRFLTEAGGYLRPRAAENTLLLSAAQAVSDAAAPDPLFGWWEPPNGGEPRGAFLHDPAVPLLIAGRAPEMAASLAAALARAGRPVCGVDAPADAADAFAAAWAQRAGVAARLHHHSLVYRLAGPAGPSGSVGPAGPAGSAGPLAAAGLAGPGPTGRLRTATAADRGLLVAWLTAFSTEVGELTGSPEATAEELLGYGGAVFWEAGGRPVAMATVTRPVMRTVRIAMMYTPPERRHNGYAVAVTLAVSRAELAHRASEVVLITDSNRPHRQAAQLGYELIGERAVLRFGPATGSIPRLPTGPIPRLASGPHRLRSR